MCLVLETPPTGATNEYSVNKEQNRGCWFRGCHLYHPTMSTVKHAISGTHTSMLVALQEHI